MLELLEPLEPEEQERLLVLYKENPADTKIRDKVILHNLRLVLWVARRYYKAGHNEIEDLFQQGILGLIKTVRMYEPGRGANFGTVAVWYIKNSIRAGCIEINQDTSIDKPLTEQPGLTMADTLIDETAQPEREAISSTYINDILKEFQPPKLREKEYRFIVKNYGLHCREQTLKEIAAECGLTAGEVVRIRNRGLAKMRRVLWLREVRERVDNMTSYYKSPDYTQPRVQSSSNASPVERIVLQRERMFTSITKGHEKAFPLEEND